MNGIDELHELADAQCHGLLTAEQTARLEALVLGDAALRRHYILYMQLHAAAETRTVEREGSGIEIHPSSLIPHPSSIPPIVIEPSSAHHSPLGSFVFSHIAAAVILGIGLLIGLAWRISLPTPERQEPGGTGYASAVGRITALADCQWHKEGSGVRGQGSGGEVVSGQWPVASDPPSALRPPPFDKTVFLGDRFAVASGLMEITYDTGAKVILQGPCTYEIDSDRGGYLAVGKLTARAEKKAEGGRRKADHYPLPTTHYPLFAVRTPTATVTDLGTEFGVEVENSGATRSHVFQGSVSIVPSPNGRRVGGEGENSRRLTTSGAPVEILHAGQSARVERGRNSNVVIIRESGQPNRFVRQIIKSPNLQISKFPSPTPGPRPLATRYHLNDLGTLGGLISRANDINAAGLVVGESTNAAGESRAFLYKNGRMQDLGTLGGNQGSAVGINSLEQIVGATSVKKNNRKCAFLYHNGVMKDLGTFGGQSASASDINENGSVVGFSENAKGIQRAFLYVHGNGMKDLGALGGPEAESHANKINASGMVVGVSKDVRGLTRAFLYVPGIGMKDLGTLGGRFSEAYGLNDVGVIVGVSSGVNHAFLCSMEAGMKDLGALGGARSIAYGINNIGQVVGRANFIAHSATFHAFVYNGGKMIDLNLCIDASIGWTLTSATAINDSGQIIGYGTSPDGNVRAFLLTPIQGLEARD